MGTDQERLHNLETQLAALIGRLDRVNPQNTTFNDTDNNLQPAQLAQFLTAALASIVESRLILLTVIRSLSYVFLITNSL